MELGTIIITLIVIIACIIPFVLISSSIRKKNQAVLQKLVALAKTQQTGIEQFDAWYNTAIGIDKSLDYLFFLKKTGELELDQTVRLSEVKDCHIINTSRTLKSKDGDLKITEKLELAIAFKQPQKEDTVMVFYDGSKDSLTMTGELQIINKWCNLVSDKLKEIRNA